MKSSGKMGGHMVDLLFTLALFCVFAASSLMVVIIGANVYKSTVSRMNENFSLRTSLSYVAQKVRQNDLAGGLDVRPFGEGNALVLEQTLEDGVYQTWIYYDAGAIRELFIQKDAQMSAQDGAEILAVENFTVEETEYGLYRFTVTDAAGKTAEVVASPRCD